MITSLSAQRLLINFVRYNRFVPLKIEPNTIASQLIDKCRLSAGEFSENETDSEKLFREKLVKPFEMIKDKSPEFLPDTISGRYDKVAHKLQRLDMYRRRQNLKIPTFYVGSYLAITVSDSEAPGKRNRFVGLCVQRGGSGLDAKCRIRNVVDGTGVEIIYELYHPLVLRIEVLKLEKRLDHDLLFLRDAPPEYRLWHCAVQQSRYEISKRLVLGFYQSVFVDLFSIAHSTVPFNMKEVPLPADNSVPVFTEKIPLNELPWERRWDLHGYYGITLPDLPYSWLRKRWRFFHAHPHLETERFDLMKRYRESHHYFDAEDTIESFSMEHSQAESDKKSVTRNKPSWELPKRKVMGKTSS